MTGGCIVLTHMGLGDSLNMIGACRYLSKFYEQVILICSNNHIRNVRMFYDKSIDIIGTNTTDYNIECNYAPEIFSILSQFPEHDILKCFVGPNSFPSRLQVAKEETKNKCFIAQFYNQLGLDFSVYSEYFYVPYTETAVDLYNMCKKYRVAFCHPRGSNANVQIDYKKYDEHDILVVNPSENIYNYDKDPQKYELASQFVSKPIIDYLLILKNARYIEIIDSCFVALLFPLSLRKELKATVKICHVRVSGRHYEQIDDAFIYYKCY